MASADLSSPRGRTQYPYALLEPWPRGPPPVNSARMHASIGRRACAMQIPPLTHCRTLPPSVDAKSLARWILEVDPASMRKLIPGQLKLMIQALDSSNTGYISFWGVCGNRSGTGSWRLGTGISKLPSLVVTDGGSYADLLSSTFVKCSLV